MKHTMYSGKVNAMLAVVSVMLFFTNSWATSHQVLHSFNPGGQDGAFSDAGLVTDTAGNHYGTTYEGGTYNVGTVFELSPNGSGGWTEKVLYSFRNGNDGAFPQAGVVLDAAGNLYGTTSQGGIHSEGTAFELSPNGSGGWTEKVLHSFGNNTDGAILYGGLIFDGAGNLYGATNQGGIYYSGTVFELSPNGSGGWTEKVLHNFNDDGADPAYPYSSLIFDGAGNLYGTTQGGGIHEQGTIFELSPKQDGGWQGTVLHSFNNDGSDGSSPFDNLVLDGAGNLYGTTSAGGIHGSGTVFALSPRQGGGWVETILHSFGNGTDGTNPQSGLVLDGAGNLYGTTYYGGIHNWGTVFELSPKQGGGWTETVLRSFNLNGSDAADPVGGVILDGAGNLYGTTLNGGVGDVGAVFQLTPQPGGGYTEAVLYSFNFAGTDGANPGFASLISDSSGNLYGTTTEGGAYDAGIAFELMPNGGGGWTEKLLYTFGNGLDASIPYATLTFDTAGNLYGTAFTGGIHGDGAVFELSPSGNGWTEKILHSFGNGSDGTLPFAGVVFDRFGNMYGTTYQGGVHGRGTVYELSPNGGGGWTEKVLHSFGASGDGRAPYAGLVIDASGNLYGSTIRGGIHGFGTVFAMSLNGGVWTEKVLHSFYDNGADGFSPYASLILDAANNLYGTTQQGGLHGDGTVFQLTPQQNGSWSERVLHSFNYNGADGAFPTGPLIFDPSGNLYGTTANGGTDYVGAVFQLTPTQGGNWLETILHNFSTSGGDGTIPQGGLLLGAGSHLYGMTTLGGTTYNSGTVFEVGP